MPCHEGAYYLEGQAVHLVLALQEVQAALEDHEHLYTRHLCYYYYYYYLFVYLFVQLLLN